MLLQEDFLGSHHMHLCLEKEEGIVQASETSKLGAFPAGVQAGWCQAMGEELSICPPVST